MQGKSSVKGPGRANDVQTLLELVEGVQNAEKLRLAGKLDRARSLCAGLLKRDPAYVAALFTMGLIQADQSHYDKALGYLHRAMMSNPDDAQILIALSGVYLKLGSSLMAARTLEQARRLSPNDANVLATLGEIYREEKEYELSKNAFESALAIDPSFTAAEIGLALNLMQIGQLVEAAEIFQKQIRNGSRSLACLYQLSQVPTGLVELDLISLLDETEPGPRQTEDEFRAQLAFAKTSALDKAGRFEEAWNELGKARRYKRAENRRNYARTRERNATLLKVAKTSTVERRIDNDDTEMFPLSLFIVGPSRSGKTSLERLVGMLPGVKRGYENPIIENSVRRAFQTAAFPTRSLLTQLPPNLSPLFRKFYLEEICRRTGSDNVLTNTLPQRTEDALRVASEIPNARFVFIKRDVNDLSIRIFMRNYASGNFHASDLRDTRDYIGWCHDMMDAAFEKMQDISLTISYEEMAKQPDAVLARVAELCDMEVPSASLPPIGDDCGCAIPYQHHIEEALRESS